MLKVYVYKFFALILHVLFNTKYKRKMNKKEILILYYYYYYSIKNYNLKINLNILVMW